MTSTSRKRSTPTVGADFKSARDAPPLKWPRLTAVLGAAVLALAVVTACDNQWQSATIVNQTTSDYTLTVGTLSGYRSKLLLPTPGKHEEVSNIEIGSNSSAQVTFSGAAPFWFSFQSASLSRPLLATFTYRDLLAKRPIVVTESGAFVADAP